jgi:hypothetical protein
MAQHAEKRKLLEFVWLNWRLVDASLCPTTKKPFDVLAEGRCHGDCPTSRVASTPTKSSWVRRFSLPRFDAPVRQTDAITVAQVSERFVFSTRRRPRTRVRLKSLQYVRHPCPADSQIAGECRPVFERAAIEK